ncbi:MULTISPECIES: hypothetical protein [unclassified Kitasatospora]|uniref:hypothetical protein n=1 Tax=unclassified Kitasatospora TaxID=2633591 RepID=UPI0033CE2352
MMPFRRQQNPNPFPASSGISAGGNITGNIQNAPGAQNATLNQHVAETSDEQLNEARRQLHELREAVERHAAQLAQPQACLEEITAVEQHLDRAGDDPTTLRVLMGSVYQHCGGVPGLVAIAGLAQQTVAALL